MEELTKIMETAGYTKPELIKAIGDKLEADNVNINEFNKEQRKRIITMYAAKILAQ
jgi:hypothetical protein